MMMVNLIIIFFIISRKKKIKHFCFFFFFVVHGSAASLLSGGSSLYGSVEERQANEMRRLKRELLDAKDQVMSLSSQLSTNVSKLFYCFFFI